jgi:glycosyltransferase involved in cell wall biosynthesis
VLSLTVITPTLNQGKFIEKAIRSVVCQGYERLQYFVIDGGSRDHTVDVITQYADRIDWWVSEPDEGQTHALAKGLERATGDVIAYLNSDDYFLPNAFSTALGALEQHPDASWVAGAAHDLDAKGEPTEFGKWVPLPPSDYEQWPRGRHWWVTFPWGVPQPSCFWRRELFEVHGGFRRDMHYAFDLEFMVRLALAGEMPLLLPDKVLSARVLHDDAKSADTSRWKSENRLLWRVHRRSLTTRERTLRYVSLLADPFRGVSRLGDWLHHWRDRAQAALVHPVLRFGGDLLEHVPERVRPRIRHRDRRRGPEDGADSGG